MTRHGRILIVDDEVNARSEVAELLRDHGFEVETAADGFRAIAKQAAFSPHVVVTDLAMPGMDGVELVKQLHALDDAPIVIVMTAPNAVAAAIEAMRAGAAEHLTKPVNATELIVVLDNAFEQIELRRETRQLRSRLRDRVAPNNVIGSSPRMQEVFEIVEQVAPSKATVLITGESGTGKELVANAIHQRSPRANGPFIKLHCAALAESLLETELFGHEKGSFTGATSRKDGRFSFANGGTLFLDEIGEISPTIQVKLLRFLQEHEFERMGGSQTIRVDVRLIAATSRKLVEEVAAGRFRQDLFYRLDVVGLEMPPLRERRSDIPALAHFFLHRFATENGKVIDGFAPDALERLVTYDWPGNVRELENAIERAVVLNSTTLLEAHTLPSNVRLLSSSKSPLIPGASLEDIERYAILETLESAGGSTSRAAAILGLSVRTIQYRLHQYTEAPPELEGPAHRSESA